MLPSLCILTLISNLMALPTANAGNVKQKPDPELLEKFEAERDAANADLRRARELQKQGERLIQEADEEERQAHEEAVRELCAVGALPASECP